MTFEKIQGIIADQLGIDTEEIKMETKLIDDLGVDSLEIFEVIMSLEEEFEVEIPNEDVEGMKSVSEMVKYIESKQN